jgi:hypothetical protein
MKIKSIVLALALSAAFVSGCATGPAPRLGYQESQFTRRVDYLRLCQQYDPLGRDCH